jgi:hypothetical protein
MLDPACPAASYRLFSTSEAVWDYLNAAGISRRNDIHFVSAKRGLKIDRTLEYEGRRALEEGEGARRGEERLVSGLSR